MLKLMLLGLRPHFIEILSISLLAFRFTVRGGSFPFTEFDVLLRDRCVLISLCLLHTTLRSGRKRGIRAKEEENFISMQLVQSNASDTMTFQ